MRYYVNVKPTKAKDFLLFIKIMKNSGVIDSYRSAGELAREGELISTEELISFLEYSRKEVEQENVISSEEVKNLVG